MFICEKCHDQDLNATVCNYTYRIHTTIVRPVQKLCEICGKIAMCIFCDSYEAEIITRKHVKNYTELSKQIYNKVSSKI